MKKIILSGRMILLIFFLIMSLVAISPKPFAEGFVIYNVEKNSSAEFAGISVGEKLISINENLILNSEDLNNLDINYGEIITIKTSENNYKILYYEDFGFELREQKTSNIQKGLDLVGGVRVVLKPTVDLSEEQIIDTLDLLEKRLNVFGVSDLTIRNSQDLEGTNYIIIEIAGANKEDVLNLVSKKGVFEAKIGNEVVFTGGKDIKSVCRSVECAGIPAQNGCYPTENGYQCRNFFRVDITPEAAELHGSITEKLTVTNGYLDKKLDLFLDNELISSLFISENLKGSRSTSFTIQGSGEGVTEQDAITNSLNNMKEMQTLLISGSLPYEVEVERVDLISAELGESFFSSAILSIILAIFGVAGAVFVRYRSWKVSVPIMITGISEVIIILGFASLIRWNLDLAAIAGIVAAVGTGVDDQIVITDEVMKGIKLDTTWRQRMAKAFAIIFAAYFTMIVSMLPLWFLGAGVLRGFALTTIVGVTIGVFITRPAFAKMIETLK